jgi:hypothetical protein
VLYLKIWQQEDGDESLDVQPLFISADQQLIAEVGELLRRRLGTVPGMGSAGGRRAGGLKLDRQPGPANGGGA